MWRCFWANAGSKRAKNLSPESKARILERSVVSNFMWKLSRWPFQKSTAIQIDKTQCRMMSYVLPCPMHPDEDIDHFCRRKARQARNVCNERGNWSVLWSKRVVSWDEHVKRGNTYHLCYPLLQFQDSHWLILQRSLFVSENSTRCTLTSGRTGTRLNIGRPQPRWEVGVKLAKDVINSRNINIRGQNAISIGTIVSRAAHAAHDVASRLAPFRS